MYAIGIIVIGVILLAIVLIFVFGLSGQGINVLDKIFGSQSEATASASDTVNKYTGNFLENLFHK